MQAAFASPKASRPAPVVAPGEPEEVVTTANETAYVTHSQPTGAMRGPYGTGLYLRLPAPRPEGASGPEQVIL